MLRFHSLVMKALECIFCKNGFEVKQHRTSVIGVCKPKKINLICHDYTD